MAIGISLIPVISHDYVWNVGIGLAFTILVLLVIFLNVGALIDNTSLKIKLRKTSLVTVTHRGTPDSIKRKQQDNKLPANDVYAASCFQKFLGKRILRLIDHNKPVVWVHFGKPQDVSERKLGLTRKHGYVSAITFEVPVDDVIFPNGFIKRLYGKYQCVIESDVVIPSNYVVYKNENGEWCEEA
jgi:hypothetical protein